MSTVSDLVFSARFSQATSIPLFQDVMDAFGCNHMAAVYYYISSINSNHELQAYSCSSYANFESGQCSSCGINGTVCRKLGFQTTHVASGVPLYMTTLSGINATNFGEDQALSTSRKPS